MDQERMFDEDLRRKESFSDYKNVDFKNPQNLHFSKGVSPWFLSEN